MPGAVDPGSSALLTDLYQLTMLQGFFQHSMEQTAVFEFFVRQMPKQRNYLVAAGLEQVVAFLEQLHFSQDEIDWLASCGRFQRGFVDYLADLRFSGDVHAMPEGTVFFPNEPIVRVTAPLPQAQLIESRVINLLQFQILIASKAARCVTTAPGRLLVDFGLRRAHGAEAGLLAARANYLAGFAGSATVLANMLFDIPVYGTMAHSFVQAHEDELAAFQRFADANPDNVVLLLDTYDTEDAAGKVVAMAADLRSRGVVIKGVRLDSGDLAAHARRVRTILDAGGLRDVTIFVSGNLDEYGLRDLVSDRAPIDGFGIGTRLDVSQDVPYLDCVYKLQEYAGTPRCKHSEGKSTWPGRKQVFRRTDNGRIVRDVVTRDGMTEPGDALLQPVMAGGRRIADPESLSTIRRRVADNLARLPDSLRSLEASSEYRVDISPSIQSLVTEPHRGGGGES